MSNCKECKHSHSNGDYDGIVFCRRHKDNDGYDLEIDDIFDTCDSYRPCNRCGTCVSFSPEDEGFCPVLEDETRFDDYCDDFDRNS